jgi:flagellar biosynthesis protein FlhB
MAEQDNSQEKTLDPTQKRLEKAREDGDISHRKKCLSLVQVLWV